MEARHVIALVLIGGHGRRRLQIPTERCGRSSAANRLRNALAQLARAAAAASGAA
jgi:hypothetical protein